MQQYVVGPPRPRGVVLALMVAIGVAWVLFAVSLNWSRAAAAVTLWNALSGSADAVLHGQVWRLVSPVLLHAPGTPSHALIALMLLYFFAVPLESEWGPRRMAVFLVASAAIANGLETLAGLVPGLGSSGGWYGAMVLANAATVAWAFANQHQVVRLFLVVPVRPLAMVALLALWHVAMLIARSSSPEGVVAPFGAMLAGWLLCDSSPLRRFWLKRRLDRLQREIETMRSRERARAARRRAGPDLRVVRGDDDDLLH